MPADYTLFQRNKKKKTTEEPANKPIWYVQYRLSDGTRTPPQSTGKTDKKEAETWAKQELYAKIRKYGYYAKDSSITLEQYTGKNFFAIGERYHLDRADDQKRYSKQQATYKSRELIVHILPEIGKVKLIDIDENIIRDFKKKKLSEISPKTGEKYTPNFVNKLLCNIAAILEYAKADKIIFSIPLIKKISQANEMKANKKGVLVQYEIDRLFSIEWGSYTAFVANLLSFSTGARLGEILAIQHKNIKCGFIVIEKSWNHFYSELNKTTKTGESRNIYIIPLLQEHIQRLIDMNPYKYEEGEDSFLFFSPQSATRPISFHSIVEPLYDALAKIGISEKDRKDRRLSFHSGRYISNSKMLQSGIDRALVMRQTGHKSDAMINHYANFNIDDMGEILEVQNDILKVLTKKTYELNKDEFSAPSVEENKSST